MGEDYVTKEILETEKNLQDIDTETSKSESDEMKPQEQAHSEHLLNEGRAPTSTENYAEV